jgi:hypothetical protein
MQLVAARGLPEHEGVQQKKMCFLGGECRPAPLVAFVVARAPMLPLTNVYNVKEVHACM